MKQNQKRRIIEMFKAGISMTSISETEKGVSYQTVTKLLLNEFKEQMKHERVQETLKVRYSQMHYARESDIFRELSIKDHGFWSVYELEGEELKILNSLDSGINYPLPFSYVDESELTDNQQPCNRLINPIVQLAS